jgi:hypothetical protein
LPGLGDHSGGAERSPGLEIPERVGELRDGPQESVTRALSRCCQIDVPRLVGKSFTPVIIEGRRIVCRLAMRYGPLCTTITMLRMTVTVASGSGSPTPQGNRPWSRTFRHGRRPPRGPRSNFGWSTELHFHRGLTTRHASTGAARCWPVDLDQPGNGERHCWKIYPKTNLGETLGVPSVHRRSPY